MKKSKDCFVINPNWGLIAVLFIAIIIIIYCLNNGIKSNLPRYNFSVLHILLLIGVLFVFGRKYVIHQEGISTYFLGIPIQRTYWYDVREVYIVQQKNLGVSDNRIYVFQISSPYAGTDIEQMDLFSLCHPFDVLNISLPNAEINACMDVIYKYYGASDSVVLIKKN